MQTSFLWEVPKRQYSVSELTEAMRQTLTGEFSDIWVAGEISGVKAAPSGHVYFTLKDAGAQLRCAMFARSVRVARCKPRDGLSVLARGKVDLYAARGDLQFLVDALEARGAGQLQIAFEQLKQKLAGEGLFESERKRPIPKFPRRIGIVTSPSGAVIRDMLHVLTRRFAGLHIRLYPALVQGEGAVEQICRGLEYFAETEWPEVVIVARGGGSIEDLWAFNEEAVARRIVASPMPVISAVGHETDFTIADFVADLRAATPSAAAELVTGTRQEVEERLEVWRMRLRQVMRYRVSEARRLLHQLSVTRAGATLQRMVNKQLQRSDELEAGLRVAMMAVIERRERQLAQLEARLARMNLQLRIAEGRRRLDLAERALEERVRRVVSRRQGRYGPVAAQLVQLSPLKILDRGYAIVQNERKQVLKDVAQAQAGEVLQVRLARGGMKVIVEETE